MRTKDWEILAVGDKVTRLTRVRASTRNPAATNPDEILVERDSFQVVQIASGTATLVRLLDQRRLTGMRSVITEAVELQEVAATAGPVDPGADGATFEWVWEAPARGEARLTGGFIVQRADGSVETERCPQPTTAKK